MENVAARRYQAQMSTITWMAEALNQLDLEWLAHTVERAQSLGPILYPAQYRDSVSLEDQAKVIKAAKELRDAVQEAINSGQ